MLRTKLRRIQWQGWLFILPAFLVVVALFIYPVASSVLYSFTNKNLIRPDYRFIGLSNYLALLRDPSFYAAFGRSILWTAASLAGQLFVGFSAALALNRIRRGSALYRTMLIIPWAFPSIVIAFDWKWILNGVYGFLNNLLLHWGAIEQPVMFLSDTRLVFLTLLFINTWFGAPLLMVNILSALQTIPKDQYEAARMDGANAWQVFCHITLHHVRGVIGLLLVLRTIWVFNNFDLIFLLTGGGPVEMTTTLPIYTYNMGWNLKRIGMASASSVVLMMFLSLVCLLYFKLLDRWDKVDEQ